MSDFLLSVDQLKCLRNDYAHNNCSICVDLCPERAINTDRRKLKIDESACTLCHGCIGVCPTEAIESQKFEPNFYIAKEIAFENNEIKQKLIGESLKMSCKDLGACLAVFDESHIISLALKSQRKIELDLSGCEPCDLNKNGKLKTCIDTFILESINFLSEFAPKKVPSVIAVKKDERRNFFKTIFKRSANIAEEINEGEIERPKTKIPLKRILLKNAIKDAIEEENRFVAGNYGFAVTKEITKDCSNCKSCVEFCPTNALFYSNDFSKIYFQSGKCTDCSICNDICDPKAFVDGFEKDMSLFAFDKAKTAIELDMRPCRSCNMAFASKNGEDICPICDGYEKNFSDMFLTAEELEARGE